MAMNYWKKRKNIISYDSDLCTLLVVIEPVILIISLSMPSQEISSQAEGRFDYTSYLLIIINSLNMYHHNGCITTRIVET